MVGTVAHSQESSTEDGALYATGGRDGVTYESCLLSNDQPIQHFVLFDSGNFVLLASLGWTIDLDLPEGAENGIQMYEYSDDVECNQGRCETTERIYRFGHSNVEGKLREGGSDQTEHVQKHASALTGAGAKSKCWWWIVGPFNGGGMARGLAAVTACPLRYGRSVRSPAPSPF